MRLFSNKRCPRCETKMPKEAFICPGCRLNFEKYNQATNTAAKQALREGEKERVLLRKGCPSDIKRWKLLLITIFGGWFGAHHYSVGRRGMGLTYTIFLIIGMLFCAAFSLEYSGALMEMLTLAAFGWGIITIMWLADIFKVCLNTYKIPVGRED